MLAVISPAKTLDFMTPAPEADFSQPFMLEDSQLLIERARQLTPAQIASLMKISDKLAGLNAARFSDWQIPFQADTAKAALFAFRGDVYTGLDADSLTPDDLSFISQHLRILSGLYGVLRPLDLMMAYRLEMGIRLDNPRGRNLYDFWGTLITDVINQSLSEQGDDLLINLASNEYFKAVKSGLIQGDIITPVFKDFKNGQYKIISFYAKKARGLMVRYMVDRRIHDVDELLEFDYGGYSYCPDESTYSKPIFKRHLS
ncbi:MAG: Peroxide stress resistance protein YaaA [Candidatus Celerinatantimonas neptuna]|nr:MAG: Peroxide stress resistance protein YaaA [Candidatus Celerinatantimonas neptuna]